MIDKDFMLDLEDEKEQQIVEAKKQVEDDPSCSLLKDSKFLQHYQRVLEVSDYQIQDETYQDQMNKVKQQIRSIDYEQNKDLLFIKNQRMFTVRNFLNYQKQQQINRVCQDSLINSKCYRLYRSLDNRFYTTFDWVAVNLAAKQSLIEQLSEQDILLEDQLYNKIETLDSYNQKIIIYIESRMKYIAPNVSALIGIMNRKQ
ncbi:unnamed protein product [Paramecium sonneborni]|uniref:Nop domain-containing protein n=1 Tax=Paramecium sonneborni TaxID=65129 RepID=A0A8S1L1W3_9CILI|nr:unnamed protein product [Paramecium sonneborni]